MSFSYAIQHRSVFGNKRVVIGSFTNDGGNTGGAILTGLVGKVDYFSITEKGAAVVANRSVINETLPKAGGSITVVCDANVNAYWMAIGV